MKTYNVGVVGSGFMGKAHTYAYKAIPFFYGELPIEVNLRAMCSLPLEAAQKAAKEYGYDIATADLGEFFDSGLDIVHVCCPNDMHKPVVMEAVKRGIHVYCEKPLTDSYEAAQEIEEALKGSKSIGQVGFQNQFVLGLEDIHRRRPGPAAGRLAQQARNGVLEETDPGREISERVGWVILHQGHGAFPSL
jgi:predicted dehydrogenase